MKEQKKVIRWIKSHKKELIIAGLSIEGIIGAILLIKNRAELKAYWETLLSTVKTPPAERTLPVLESTAKTTEEVVKKVTTTAKADVIPFEVSMHIRKLPKGQHASPAKIATALENGFELMNGQTWVESYVKGVVA